MSDLELTFWKAIDRIQVTLGLSESKLCELLQITPLELKRLKTWGGTPHASGTLNLCRSLNIGFDELVTARIDYQALACQYSGTSSILPRCYAEGAFSRRRAASGILSYIEHEFGWRKRALTLQRFQMTEKMFEVPDEGINVKFAADVARFIVRQSGSPEMLFSMGAFMIWSQRNAPFAIPFKGTRSHREAFEKLISEKMSDEFSKNFTWKLSKLTAEGCLLMGKPDPEALEQVGMAGMSDPVVARIREGAFSNFPSYAGLSPVRLKKISCLSEGSSAFSYWVQFNSDS